MKNNFKKVYTRDTSIIIQQAWFNILNSEIEKYFGKNPFKPPLLHYIHDGVIEIWENRKSLNWIINKLQSKNSGDKDFYKQQMVIYAAQLKSISRYWDRGCTGSKVVLGKFINMIFESTLGFMIMYYSSINDKTPQDIKSKADQLRKKDKFFDENDKFIRKSLRKIYPTLKGRETGILREEIKAPPSIGILKKRQNNFIVFGEEKYFLQDLKTFAVKNKEFNFSFEKTICSDRVKGLTAYHGHAIGRARILKKKNQINSIKKGEILVSIMTTPDFVPAMKKAAAFITDEGGIMCHAAIIARELRKPCLVGTKVATRIFQDGDLIEVDTSKGIARIIK